MVKLILALLVVSLAVSLSAAQTYDLNKDVIDDGGRKMTSSGYVSRGSFGQPTIGKISSSGYIAYIGFWCPWTWPGVNELQVFAAPPVFSLSQNCPNPVARSTTIEYGLPKETLVDLRVFNVAGRQVRTLVSKKQGAGCYKVIWDLRGGSGDHMSSGIYFYRIKAGGFVQTRKMVILK